MLCTHIHPGEVFLTWAARGCLISPSSCTVPAQALTRDVQHCCACRRKHCFATHLRQLVARVHVVAMPSCHMTLHSLQLCVCQMLYAGA